MEVVSKATAEPMPEAEIREAGGGGGEGGAVAAAPPSDDRRTCVPLRAAPDARGPAARVAEGDGGGSGAASPPPPQAARSRASHEYLSLADSARSTMCVLPLTTAPPGRLAEMRKRRDRGEGAADAPPSRS